MCNQMVSIVHIVSICKTRFTIPVQWKSTYIVKLSKLRIVKDEVHSGLFGKDGAIAEGVSHSSQPWSDLEEVCVCIPKTTMS